VWPTLAVLNLTIVQDLVQIIRAVEPRVRLGPILLASNSSRQEVSDMFHLQSKFYWNFGMAWALVIGSALEAGQGLTQVIPDRT
jgi:hypothetical protein